MARIKLPKIKKYSYTPRYYNDKGEGNPFEIKHKFDEFRSTVGAPKDLKSRFNAAINDYKNNQDDAANKRVLIIITVLVIVFLFIIGFDLSIFFS